MRPMRSLALVVALLAAVVAARVATALPDAPAAVVVSADAKQPSVAVAADGSVWVAFLRGGNVAVAVSKDRGRTFGEPRVAIDAKGRARGGRQRGPRIGVSGDGTLVVTAPLTFDEAEAAKKYPTPELWLASSSDGGVRWTAPVRVNEVEKQAPEGLHATAVARDGTVHVAWLDRRGRGARGQDLWYARVAAGKVGANARIAQDVCECCAPGLALDGAGDPCIVWREGGDATSREILSARSADGGVTFGKAVRVNRAETKEHT